MIEILTINKRSIKLHTQLFINGEWTDPKQGKKFDIEDPSTGKNLVARKAFKTWSKTDARERAKILFRLADLMEQHGDDLIAIECADTGKTFKSCTAIDLPASVATIRYYAGWADKIHGTTVNTPGMMAYTRREPIGVCGQITPWNFPLLMFCWKIGPALATGNVVVIKTAESTPLSALKMAELIKEAGFPPGVFNLVSGFGKTAGAAIAKHMDIDKVAFTGSTVTGREILKAAATSNLKKVTLELGGKSPNIIFDDADVEQAVKWSSFGINLHMGQVCHAGSRIYVQEGIYDKFLKAFTAEMKSRTVGDQWSGSDQGPQNSKMQHDKILSLIASGREEGATVHLGGNKIEKDGGYYIEPTIFTDVRPEFKIMREEIFGPVVSIAKFKTEEEVLEWANDTDYGLAGGCFTKDYARAVRVSEALRAGTVWVNMFNFLTGILPFGGYKQSGIGRECGEAVLQNYLETKSVYWNMGIDCPPL
ncbi:MAG: hypothetical protein GOMPHAMPRED_003746 [Gomphillus americanus]|uniref:aldehyde dehydrogenase (NAD(+)) n=1 Tax=Gomphillus americanus TaxID=1940652 RepID=A0A8H3IMV1_9LECA|nr:MAG: hypothetical protein GOMPHAMPRED_003746 [Gomphillus americanus]